MPLPLPIRMMSALIIRAIVDDHVLPPLAAAGHAVDMIWDPTLALMERIRRGETADGIVAIAWALDELERQGRIVPGSRRPFAQAAFGLAVAGGAPKPDIATVAALRATLLDIPSLVYSRAGASGVYFERVIDELGIGDAVRAKAIVIPAGLTGEMVASGEAHLAIQQISELFAVPGIDFLGPFPAPIQQTTDFDAAILTDATDIAGPQAFLERLFSAPVRDACEASGLNPFFA